MFIKKNIELIHKTVLYDFLNNFLFQVNKKEDTYFRTILYIYFTFKTRFYKRYSSIKILNFYFTLFSIEFCLLNPTKLLYLNEFVEFLRNRLNILAYFNRANITDLMYMFLISYTPRFIADNYFEYKRNKRKKSMLYPIYFTALNSVERAKNNSQFDYLYLREVFKHIHDHFEYMRMQYNIDHYSHNRKAKTDELLIFYKKISQMLKYFTKSELRESLYDVGDLVKTDPRVWETFLRVYHQNLQGVLDEANYRRTFRITISKFFNLDKYNFDIFEDLDYPLWKDLSQNIQAWDLLKLKTKINLRKYLTNTNMNIYKICYNKKNINNFINIKNKNFNNDYIQCNKIDSDEVLNVIYETEEEYIAQFNKDFIELNEDELCLVDTPYIYKKSVNILSVIKNESSLKDRDETLAAPGDFFYKSSVNLN